MILLVTQVSLIIVEGMTQGCECWEVGITGDILEVDYHITLA